MSAGSLFLEITGKWASIKQNCITLLNSCEADMSPATVLMAYHALPPDEAAIAQAIDAVHRKWLVSNCIPQKLEAVRNALELASDQFQTLDFAAHNKAVRTEEVGGMARHFHEKCRELSAAIHDLPHEVTI